MSLYVAPAASRHLGRRLLADAAAAPRLRVGGGNGLPSASTRLLSGGGPGGTGLRRTRAKGRHTSTPKSQSSSGGDTTASAPTYDRRADPHQIANEMVSRPTSAEGRAPGTESVATLTREQRLSNFAMAAGLFGFVSYVFYYSLASVGGDKSAKALLFGSSEEEEKKLQEGEGSSVGFEEFLKEANEGRAEEEGRRSAEREARGEVLAAENAIAAEEGLGEDEEREMAKTAGFVDGEAGEAPKRRPLWKRVVFFWRRE